MIFRIMETLRIYPPRAVVKIGDTVPDIGEGLNAGAVSIGVVSSGSEVGCTHEELAALPETGSGRFGSRRLEASCCKRGPTR